MDNLKAVKNQNDFHESESKQSFYKHKWGKGGILFLPPFYIDPSHYPNHAGSGWLNAQIWLKEQWMAYW